ARGEIKPRLLLVVDEERRRLLLVEGRQPLPLAPGLHELHALAHHLRYRKAGAQLIEELGRKAHDSQGSRGTESGPGLSIIPLNWTAVGRRSNDLKDSAGIATLSLLSTGRKNIRGNHHDRRTHHFRPGSRRLARWLVLAKGLGPAGIQGPQGVHTDTDRA